MLGPLHDPPGSHRDSGQYSAPPGPQRFYELLSFQIYGAIAGVRPRAKLLYSEYCKCAPQVRYGDFDHVKKQMWKLHQPHREAGYITKVDYEETSDLEGNADWEMFYTPGPKAFTEYQAFTNRQAQSPMLAFPDKPAVIEHTRKPSQALLGFGEEESKLLPELTRRGIAEQKARDLLIHLKPGQEVMDQLEYVDSLVAKDTRGKLKNPPGLYVFYLRDNVAPPADFWSSRKAKLQEQSQQIKDAELARKARLEIEYDNYRSAEIKRFAGTLPADEYRQIFEEQRLFNRGVLRSMSAEQLDDLTHCTVRGKLEADGRVRLLSFEEFCASRALTTG